MKKIVLCLLFLAGCKGTGCTTGDFMEMCSKSCGGKVKLILPHPGVCICEDGTEKK